MNASEIAYRLGRLAEAVCRHYLGNGRREGRYWRVGDARNEKGRSVYVRLIDDRGRLAGKWQDTATGEHGDLVDIIREACGFTSQAEAFAEARRFLNEPPPSAASVSSRTIRPASDLTASARRLFGASRPIRGTLAEDYLRGRGLTQVIGSPALRFHPRCFYGGEDAADGETWPGLIASATDLSDLICGVHRTYLDPQGFTHARLGKAPVDCPKRSLGDIFGCGVRFGKPQDVLAAGEGIETVASFYEIAPSMPSIACLSATHLGGLVFPPGLQRLYVLKDCDTAGETAALHLAERAHERGIDAVTIEAVSDDLNSDLRRLGVAGLARHIVRQLRSSDMARIL